MRPTGFIVPDGPDLFGRARSAVGRVGAVGLARPKRHTIGQPRITDQHGNSCVGHVLYQQERLWRYARGIPGSDVSPYYPYWWARRRAVGDRSMIGDFGCQPYHAVRAARRNGLTRIDAWNPELPGFGINTAPPASTRISAQRTTLDLRPIYASGWSLVERVVDAISLDRPVMLAIPVDDAFMRDDGPEVIPAPMGSTAGMLHAVTAIGYRPGEVPGTWHVRIANSWGTRYRDNGCAWLSHDAVAGARWAGELVSVKRHAGAARAS